MTSFILYLKIGYKKIDMQYRPTTRNVESDRTSVSITNSISQSRNNVNMENSENNNDINYRSGRIESLATTPSENKSLSQTSETLSGTAFYKNIST